MNAQRRFAVAGATGRVGRQVVDVLRADGHDVVEIARSCGVDVHESGGLLPRRHATLAGPTFAEWLDCQ